MNPPQTQQHGSEYQLIKRSDPWFNDGTIVIQAESIQFRVYRGILAATSQIFSDMFSIPQPSDNESVEGCAVVHVSDSAEDWQYVLKALCERSYVPVSGSLPIAVIAAFLRLGRKYEIVQLHTEAVTRLEYEFPSSLKECEEMVDFTMIDDTGCLPSLVFEVIQLARENDLQCLLPWAYYLCCRFSFEDIFNSFESRNGRRVELSTEDKRACITGWRKLASSQSSTPFCWLTCDGYPEWTLATFAACEDRAKCIAARKAIHHELFPDMLICNAVVFWDSAWEVSMCAICVSESRREHDAGLAERWELLPSVFGLPDWDELLSSKASIPTQ